MVDCTSVQERLEPWVVEALHGQLQQLTGHERIVGKVAVLLKKCLHFLLRLRLRLRVILMGGGITTTTTRGGWRMLFTTNTTTGGTSVASSSALQQGHAYLVVGGPCVVHEPAHGFRGATRRRHGRQVRRWQRRKGRE